MRWWPFAFLLLAYPAIMTGAWLLDGPVAGGNWQVDAEVISVDPMDVEGRFEPLAVARVEIHRVVATGAGPSPSGVVEVAMPEWVPGAEEVREGRRLRLALSPYEMHGQNGQTTFEGFHLEDARGGCCWATRTEQAARMWPVFAAALLMLPVAYWADRTQRLRPWWPLAVAAAGAAGVAWLAADWSTEPLRLIVGDGEENYAIGAAAFLLVALAVASWAVQAIARQPVAWVAAAAWVLVYPVGVMTSPTPDPDLAAAFLPVIPLAVLAGQRRWIWISRSAGLLALAVAALLAFGAVQAPHGTDPAASLVLAIGLGGGYVPSALDGLGRPSTVEGP